MKAWELIHRNMRRQMGTASNQRQPATVQERYRDGVPARDTRVET
jgi:hypothetical protein